MPQFLWHYLLFMKKNFKIILASNSPRRKELIKEITENVIISPSTIKEEVEKNLPAEKVAMSLARQKAEDVAKKFKGELVLGADTIVVFEDKILGKPIDEYEAFQMLSSLSGKTHKVITGICLIRDNLFINDFDETIVTFNNLSPEFIESYIKTGSPMDKAGAYGVQDEAFELVNKYEGSFTNVVGLPIELLRKILKENEGKLCIN